MLYVREAQSDIHVLEGCRALSTIQTDSEIPLIHLLVRHLSFSTSGKGALRNTRGWGKDKKSKCDFYPEFKISCTLNLAYLCYPELLFKCCFAHVEALVELVVVPLTSLRQGLLSFNRTLGRNVPMARRKQHRNHM